MVDHVVVFMLMGVHDGQRWRIFGSEKPRRLTQPLGSLGQEPCDLSCTWDARNVCEEYQHVSTIVYYCLLAYYHCCFLVKTSVSWCSGCPASRNKNNAPAGIFLQRTRDRNDPLGFIGISAPNPQIKSPAGRPSLKHKRHESSMVNHQSSIVNPPFMAINW